jgi:hypothetical protein
MTVTNSLFPGCMAEGEMYFKSRFQHPSLLACAKNENQ